MPRKLKSRTPQPNKATPRRRKKKGARKSPSPRTTKEAAQTVADPGPESDSNHPETDGSILLDALDTGAESDREFLRDVIASVRFTDHPKHHTMAIEWFHVFKALATFDLWTDWPDEVKLVSLGKWLRYTHYTAPDITLEQLRGYKDYKRVKDNLLAAMEKFGRERSPEEWVADSASEAFGALYSIMQRGETQQKAVAARDFTDRAAPKVRRTEQERTVQVHFPAGVLEGFEAGVDELRRLIERDQKQLSGEVVDVEVESVEADV